MNKLNTFHHNFPMRKLLTTLALGFCLCGFQSALAANDTVVINCDQPGSLEVSSEALSARNLKITGTIDARDFLTLQEITLATTRVLDLSEAKIAAYQGNDGCYDANGSSWQWSDVTYTYDADYIPTFAFTNRHDDGFGHRYAYGSYTLRKLIVPADLKGFQAESIEDNWQLTCIEVPETSTTLWSDGTAVYSYDRTELVKVVPGFTGGLTLPSTVKLIRPTAFNGTKLAYVEFTSQEIPEMTDVEIDAAYILAPNPDDYAALFTEIDCIDKITPISVEAKGDGSILTEIGNQGATRYTARSIVVTGELSTEDIDALLKLPNLHILDMSGASTSVESITIPRGALTELKAPSGYYSLKIENDDYLQGDFEVPSGVWWFNCHNTRFTSLKATTLQYCDLEWDSSFKKIDLSACSLLNELTGLNYAGNLEELLLPNNLKKIETLTYAPISNLALPSKIESITGLANLDLTSITFPESLTALVGFNYMPLLAEADMSQLKNITSIGSVFHRCPNLHNVDLSNCTSLTQLYGFGGNDDRSYFVTSSSRPDRYPACGNGLKSVIFPVTLKTFDGFLTDESIPELDFMGCYALTSIQGLYNCPSLTTLKLPASLKSLDALEESTALTSIFSAATSVPDASSVKWETMHNVDLIVPIGSQGGYGMAEGWCDAKSITEGGYSVAINSGVSQTPALYGSGLYAEGSTVELWSDASFEVDGNTYTVGEWNLNNGTILDGSHATFTINENVSANPIYYSRSKDPKDCDVYFDFVASEDVNYTISFWYREYSYSIYDENERLTNYTSSSKWSDNVAYTLHLKEGHNSIGIDGEIGWLLLNENYDKTGRVTLSDLNVKNPSNIYFLDLNYLGIEALELVGYDQLMDLSIDGNNFAELDFSQLPWLQSFSCVDNQFTRLDLSPCEMLNYVDCGNNMLQEIILPDSPYLTNVTMYDNPAGFSLMTPELYALVANGNETVISYKATDEEFPSTGIIDLSKEAYAKGTDIPTEFMFLNAGGHIYEPSRDEEGHYIITKPGTYHLSMTNEAYPGLTFYVNSFEVADNSNLVDLGVHTIDGITYRFVTNDDVPEAWLLPYNETEYYTGDLYVPTTVEFEGTSYTVMYHSEEDSDDDKGPFAYCRELTSLSLPCGAPIFECTGLVHLEFRNEEQCRNLDYMISGSPWITHLIYPATAEIVRMPNRMGDLQRIEFQNQGEFTLRNTVGEAIWEEFSCPNLKDISFASAMPPALTGLTFNCNSEITLHIPVGSSNQYNEAGWSQWTKEEYTNPLGISYWDYCGSDYKTRYGAVSLYEDCNVEAALKLTNETLAPYIGSEIIGVEFYVKGDDSYYEAEYIFATSADVDYLTKDPIEVVTDAWNTKYFSNPIPITGEEDLYVGIGRRDALGVDWANENLYEEASWWRTMGDVPYDSSVGQWRSWYKESGNSTHVMPMRAIIKGADLPTDLIILNFETIGGDDSNCENPRGRFTVANRSSSIVTDFKVNANLNGADLGLTEYTTYMYPGHSYEFYVDLAKEEAERYQDINICITEVNSKADAYSPNSDIEHLYTLPAEETFPRKGLVEMTLATWNFQSPLGIATIDYMTENYPDQFVYMTIHKNDVVNQEPMWPGNQFDEYFDQMSSINSTRINRKTIIDWNTKFDNLVETGVGQVSAQAHFGTQNNVIVNSETTFGFYGHSTEYRLAYVLLEDNVGPYEQQNICSGWDQPYYSPLDLSWWMSQDYYAMATFNDVTRAIYDDYYGVEGSLPMAITPGEVYSAEYEFTLPTNVQDWRNLKIAVLLLDGRTGEVMNVDLTTIDGENGLAGIFADDNEPFDIYNLSGIRVRSNATSFDGLPSGIYIARGQKVRVQ